MKNSAAEYRDYYKNNNKKIAFKLLSKTGWHGIFSSRALAARARKNIP
jgi:hypothetical protein